MNLNVTRRARLSRNISGHRLALSSTTPRNVLRHGSITALVWDCLHETRPESVERIVYRPVGAQQGIVILDAPRQVLLPQVTGNSFIRVVFSRLTSLTFLPPLQQHQSSSSCAIQAAMVPSVPLLLSALRRTRQITTHQMWHTRCSGGLKRGGPISMIRPLLRRYASSMDSRAKQAPGCAPVWVAFA